MIPVGILAAGKSAAPVFTYNGVVNNVQVPAGTDTVTLNNQSIGSVSADRIVVVGTSFAGGAFGGNVSVSGVTCNGIAMSRVKTPAVNGVADANIWYLKVPTGTTANFVFTFVGSTDERGGQITFGNMKGQEQDTPYYVNGNAGTSFSATVNVLETAVSFAGASADSGIIFTVSSMSAYSIHFNAARQVGSSGKYDMAMLASFRNNSASGSFVSTPANVSGANDQERLLAIWR